MIIPIEVSARHIHLSRKHLEVLFGKGYQLTNLRDLPHLSRSGLLFAAKETLRIKNGDKEISKVRISGPVRAKTQVELSFTDCFYLGISPPIRKSGDLKRTPGLTLIGPKGKIKIKEGVIVVLRHIHICPDKAKKLKLKNGDLVSVKIKGKRSVTFHNVLIRIDEKFKLVMHIDTDEANAAGISKGGKGYLVVNRK